MPLSAEAREACAPWLQLVSAPGLGPVAIRRLLETFGLPEDVLAAGHGRLSAALDAARAQALLGKDPARDAAVQAALDWAEAADHHLLTLDDPRYPARLLEIGDPPPVLFVHGDPSALSRPSLAIVGSRNATRAGLGHAHDFARALGDAGLTIISGLAHGIDAAAHRGALDTAAGTVAVVGTGIDRVYPAAHRKLADAIVAGGGALASELPLGFPVQPANFPRRNRLIAGLALATLVVEAARHSGSLITARQAAEAGREVMAIPGSIHSPLSRGCHRLIRDGAKLIESAEDVLAEIRGPLGAGHPLPKSTSTRRPPIERSSGGAGEHRHHPCGPSVEGDDSQLRGAGEDEHAALLRAMAFDPIDVDELVSRTGQPAGRLGALLLRLELDGKVERLVDGRFARLGG